MKKKVFVLAALLSMTMLTGCCIKHDWQEATCEAPKTCAKCGETEGEALGHVSSGVANYQDAEVCEVCGKVLTEALVADFETYGLALNGSTEGTAFTTVTKNDKETTGLVFFTTDDATSTGPNGEAVDGYEWIHATTNFRFNDEAAQVDGARWHTTTEDYYTISLHDESTVILWENEEEQSISKQYTVNYKGTDYDQCVSISKFTADGWSDDGVYSAHYDYYFCVPVGYDGTVIGVYSGAANWEDGQYIYDMMDCDTILYKLR